MSARPPALSCRDLSVAYGDARVLDGIQLEIRAGETMALLGPSGSGKTTLLYAVAGFVPPATGEIAIEGALVADPRRQVQPERRSVAVVFQHYALWPHLTAAETVAYPMRRRGMGGGQATARAGVLLELLGIGHLAGRRPASLSGGEQQRVGLARALAREASLILLDEPTAHLDTPLRARLMAELAEQRRRSGAAALYATHDVGEALAVADRVALLRDGRIAQLGTPREIYECPVDPWAARLSGPASILDAALLQRVAGEAALEGARGEDVRVLVRPDWVALGGSLPGTVASVLYRGPHTDYRLSTPYGELEVRQAGPPTIGPGDEATWSLRRGWLLEAPTDEPS